MLCINAPLQLCNKQCPVEAPRKSHDKVILKHTRQRTEPRRKTSAPTASLTKLLYCKIQGIHSSPLLGRATRATAYIWEISNEIAVAADGPCYGHHRSPADPAHSTRYLDISLEAYHLCTMRSSVPYVPQYLDVQKRRLCGGRRASTYTCSGTDGIHLRYSFRRTS